MPAQTTKPTFAGTFGAAGQQAAAKHGRAPGKPFGQQELPGGIKNGVARLEAVELRRFEDDTNMKQADGSSAKGQLYVRMVAVVETPKTFQDKSGVTLKLEGRQFSQMIPLCAKGCNYRGAVLPDLDACIGVVASEIHLIAPTLDTSNLDAALATVNAAKPKLRFIFQTNEVTSNKIDPKTKKPYAPRVFTDWLGSDGLVAAPPTGPGDHVNDQTASGSANGHAEGTAPASANGFNEFQNGAVAESDDLMALAQMVDEDALQGGKGMADQNSDVFRAAEKLGAAAKAAGISDDDIANVHPNWAAVVETMNVGDTTGGDDDVVTGDDDVVEEVKEWQEGDECEFTPKGAKEPVRVKITRLSPKKTKANVVNVKNARSKFENVPIDALTRPA